MREENPLLLCNLELPLFPMPIIDELGSEESFRQDYVKRLFLIRLFSAV